MNALPGEPILGAHDIDGMRFYPMKGEIFFMSGVWDGDLSILTELGLLTSKINSTGKNYNYSVRKAGYDAIDTDFVDVQHDTATINIGAIIQEMLGGNIQAAGSISNSQITLIANNPDKLLKQVSELTENLIAEVKNHVSASSLAEYEKLANEFKKEILSVKLDRLSNLARALSFFGDLEGTISLASRLWLNIYPLMLIAAERLQG